MKQEYEIPDLHSASLMSSTTAQEKSAKESAHLLPLADSSWSFWRCAALRGAGFPAQQALALAAPECAILADQSLQASPSNSATGPPHELSKVL